MTVPSPIANVRFVPRRAAPSSIAERAARIAARRVALHALRQGSLQLGWQ
jgi:hypothetical protein